MDILRTDKEEQSGHAKEWSDRARVILDMKKEMHATMSPNQSPDKEDVPEGAEEKSEKVKTDVPY